MNLHSVEAVIVSENYACKSTFKKMALYREGLFENLYFQGSFDSAVYSLLNKSKQFAVSKHLRTY
jgi:hypothetical protein